MNAVAILPGLASRPVITGVYARLLPFRLTIGNLRSLLDMAYAALNISVKPFEV